MVVAMVCVLAAPAFAAGTNPLNFVDANICTINGQTATPGISIVNNTSVPSGTEIIELQLDKNVVSDVVYNGQTVYAHNQGSVTLKDISKAAYVSISVYRLGDGTPADLEKQHLFFNANLVAGDNYEITIDSSLIANNGLTLGTTKTVDFTAQ